MGDGRLRPHFITEVSPRVGSGQVGQRGGGYGAAGSGEREGAGERERERVRVQIKIDTQIAEVKAAAPKARSLIVDFFSRMLETDMC